MKIEIGESLTYSYLKHVEGCRIVQTNWKTSGKWVITEYELERARNLFNKIKSSDLFEGIFKSNSLEQLIKQAEIDVLGINTTENTIYGIDVAFHAAGLNYGSKEETTERIIKKIFRTIFIMQSYFDEYEKFNSFFVTPKAINSVQSSIDAIIIEAQKIINDENISIKFISNEEFYSLIVDPIINDLDEENDTSELFSRAVKLMKIDSRSNQVNETVKVKSRRIITTDKRTINGMKIGQFVQYSFRKAFDQNLISPLEINKLQSLSYSKLKFNMGFEVLRNMNLSIKDDIGRNRYYAREVFCNNYHLTSQWIESQWDLLLAWLNQIGYDYREVNENN